MPATASSPVRDAITAANRRFMDSFRAQDAAALAALYTSSGSVLPPRAAAAEGPVAVQRFWEEVFRLGIAEATLESLEVEGGDRFAYEVGRYAMMTSDGQTADEGKYVVIWKRDGDRWMIHRDIWNTSRT